MFGFAFVRPTPPAERRAAESASRRKRYPGLYSSQLLSRSTHRRHVELDSRKEAMSYQVKQGKHFFESKGLLDDPLSAKDANLLRWWATSDSAAPLVQWTLGPVERCLGWSWQPFRLIVAAILVDTSKYGLESEPKIVPQPPPDQFPEQTEKRTGIT
eukprot:5755207-Amphidinium_carterae.1